MPGSGGEVEELEDARCQDGQAKRRPLSTPRQWEFSSCYKDKRCISTQLAEFRDEANHGQSYHQTPQPSNLSGFPSLRCGVMWRISVLPVLSLSFRAVPCTGGQAEVRAWKAGDCEGFFT